MPGDEETSIDYQLIALIEKTGEVDSSDINTPLERDEWTSLPKNGFFRLSKEDGQTLRIVDINGEPRLASVEACDLRKNSSPKELLNEALPLSELKESGETAIIGRKASYDEILSLSQDDETPVEKIKGATRINVPTAIEVSGQKRTLPTKHISREHCAIRYNSEKERWEIMDLSKNGTFIMGEKGQPRIEGSFASTPAVGGATGQGKERNENQDSALIIAPEAQGMSITNPEGVLQNTMEIIKEAGYRLYVVADGVNSKDGIRGAREGAVISSMASAEIAQRLAEFIRKGGPEAALKRMSVEERTELMRRIKERLEGQGLSKEAITVLLTGENSPKYQKQQLLLEQLEKVVRETNETIRNYCQEKGINGGTSLTVALKKRALYLAHAGSTRAYLLMRDGKLTQLTKDHTIKPNKMHPFESPPPPYNYLGPKTRQLKIEMITFFPTPGDRLVLCTDGLTEEVTRQEIAALLEDQKNNGEAARKLVEMADEKGGKDDATVICTNLT